MTSDSLSCSSAYSTALRDHGGNLATAIETYGGTREDWIDLSTGINPTPYPLPQLHPRDWTALPDADAQAALLAAARRFWQVPRDAEIIAAPGASALIARLPALWPAGQVAIAQPTYNEHAAAFARHGWQVMDALPASDSDTPVAAGAAAPLAQVAVHPNNPDGRLWDLDELVAPLRIIDESFCDICPQHSLIGQAARPGTLVLKSFGKFWGLAGLRLGFAIARPELIIPLREMLGPWAVSGPALRVATQALGDVTWAENSRRALARQADELDQLMLRAGAQLVGGSDLFRLYEVDAAARWQDRLARNHIWSRIFPYSDRLIRLGLPPADRWAQIQEALA